MSMFIGHFALTPEPLVRLSWNFVLRIPYTRGRSGANPIRPKNVGHPEDRPLCKGTEEHEGRRIIQMIICNILCSSVPLILVIWKSVLFANDHLQRNGGGRIIQMIICNNFYSSVPLILVIRRTVLFANVKERRKNCREEQLLIVLGQYRPVLAGIWWSGSVWGSTGWKLVILGQ